MATSPVTKLFSVSVDIPCMPWHKFSRVILCNFATKIGPGTYWNSLGKVRALICSQTSRKVIKYLKSIRLFLGGKSSKIGILPPKIIELRYLKKYLTLF